MPASSPQPLKDKIRQLWEVEKLTASEIAIKIGGLTRSQVLGHAHRMKLSSRANVLSPPRPRVRAPYVPKPVVVAPPSDAPPSLNLELINMKDGQCRFPYGESNFVFCGQPSTGPFCLFHRAACFTPANRRAA